MLRLQNIRKIYQANNADLVVALDDISLDFRKSEFVSVLGSLGCDKTTLLI